MVTIFTIENGSDRSSIRIPKNEILSALSMYRAWWYIFPLGNAHTNLSYTYYIAYYMYLIHTTHCKTNISS